MDFVLGHLFGTLTVFLKLIVIAGPCSIVAHTAARSQLLRSDEYCLSGRWRGIQLPARKLSRKISSHRSST